MEIESFKNLMWHYTRQINEHTNNVFNPIFATHGLTMLQARALMELKRVPEPHTIGNLAQNIYAAETNISTLCKKLENKGLVKRVRDQVDERVVNVVLTEKGMETVRELDDMLDQRIARHLEEEQDEVLEEIIKGFERFNRLMQRIATSPEETPSGKENSHEL